MTTEAEIYAGKHRDVSDLMSTLDKDEIQSAQDWVAGTTTWIFADGSVIVVSGSEVITAHWEETK